MTQDPTSDCSTKVDFSGFILSLAQSVLIDLGMAPNPESGEMEKNLTQACHSIEILTMIAEKTRGNLSDDEARLLQGTLYQLRLSYVEATRA
jgi:hypothetical protein